LRSYLKENLDDTQFFSLVQLHQRALTCESRSKEASKSANHNVHLVERDPSSSYDESTYVYIAELVWPTKAKPSACSSLYPVKKNQQEDVRFTLNVAKCDKVLDELAKSSNIKVTHNIPPLDELKRRA
jgi:hypothetical protein